MKVNGHCGTSLNFLATSGHEISIEVHQAVLVSNLQATLRYTHGIVDIPMVLHQLFSLNRKGKWYQVFVRIFGQTSRRLEHNTPIPFGFKVVANPNV